MNTQFALADINRITFSTYLNSLGVKKQAMILNYVDGFKHFAFDFILSERSSNSHAIINALKFYLNEINLGYSLQRVSKRQRTQLFNALKKYFEFIQLHGLVSEDWHELLNYKTKTKKRRNAPTQPTAKRVFHIDGRKKKDYVQNETFRNYIDYLKRINTSSTNIESHYSTISYFLRFLSTKNVTNLNLLHYENITSYEKHLEQRYLLKEIKKKTAYDKLSRLKQFINYLNQNDIVNFKYAIPRFFKGYKICRENEYVTMDDQFKLIESIIKTRNKRRRERDLAIVLVLIDVGCRPLEICNIKLSDVNTSESQLTLYCQKSGQRNLHVDKFVMNQIQKYMDYRCSSPTDTDYLFLLETGKQMNTRAIGALFNLYNKTAFGECRFSAKSLRHTYITNALNDRNDINKVAQTAGHKHLVSTMHYFYKSIETLLKNTLPHNPVIGAILSDEA